METKIKDMQQMNNNQIIRTIDFEYFNTIKKQLKKIKKSYQRIPLEIEDMYNIFLSKVPLIIKEYDGKMDFKYYLASKIHYTLKNTIKHFLTKRQKFLNNYLHIDLIEYKLQDLTKISFIDVSPLNDVELEIYNDHILSDLSYGQIVKKRKCTLHLVRTTMEKIKDKLENQVV